MFDLEPSSIVLFVLAISLVLFVTDRLRYDLIAVGVAVVLAATGCLTAEQAFAGFSSPAVMLIASMFVFGAAMKSSGVAERIGQSLLSSERGGEASLIVRSIGTSEPGDVHDLVVFRQRLQQMEVADLPTVVGGPGQIWGECQDSHGSL